MTKRSYNRRTPEEIVADLEAQIAKQEERLAAQARAEDPVLKSVPALLKRLRRFAQQAHDNGRADLGNSTTAFVASLERMLRES
jgi:hypothetical protein